MKFLIDTNNYLEYLNENATVSYGSGTAVVAVKGDGYSGSLLMRTEQDTKNNVTLKFNLKYEYNEYPDGVMAFQREFMIEHHPGDKSVHVEPHVQICIHGPKADNKVGEIWITLELKNDEEYKSCIKGFFYVLEEVMKACKDGIEKELLNVNEVNKLKEQRTFLIGKIKDSLLTNGIELKSSKDEKITINANKLKQLLKKDQSLLPLFPDSSE